MEPHAAGLAAARDGGGAAASEVSVLGVGGEGGRRLKLGIQVLGYGTAAAFVVLYGAADAAIGRVAPAGEQGWWRLVALGACVGVAAMVSVLSVTRFAGDYVRAIEAARGAEDSERQRRWAEERYQAAKSETSEWKRAELALLRSNQRLHALNAFGRSVTSTLDLDSASAVVVGEVARLVGARRCVVLEWVRSGVGDEDLFRYRGEWNNGTIMPPRPALTFAARVGRTVARSGVPLVVDDTRLLSEPEHADRARNGILSIVAVPILVGGSPWGVLSVGFPLANAGSPDTVELLLAFSAHLAIAVNNAGLYGSLREKHEQLQLSQEQVVQQERMRALGAMASGIAHDFNNALAPVVGFSELLLLHPEDLRDSAKAARYLTLIHTGAQDAANVVGRLREFYRPREHTDVLATVDVSQLAQAAVALTQPKWKDQAQAAGHTVVVDFELHDVSPVAGNESELRELFTNLIFNAVDAMPQGGTITLRTRQRGTDVLVEIADTGMGMTDDVRRRCLEPFFSTKGERGTGLGLAMVHGIVQRHGGGLEIDSAVGGGTTIRLRFASAAVAASGEVAPATTPHRRLRVLVVDDEVGVRAVTAAYFGADGHEVDEAQNGREALTALAAADYDLVVTDRAMPGMSGDQLAAAVKGTRPTLPVILLTGFGDLMLAQGEAPAGVDLVLGKPITLDRLRTAIGTVVPPG